MKKRLALLLAAFMLLTSVSVFSVGAAEVVTDKTIADFESEASRNGLVASGEYNFFTGTTAAVSTDVKASGESAMRVTLGEAGDNLQDIRYIFTEAQDLSKVEYITFYIKNEGALPLGIGQFSPITFNQLKEEQLPFTHAADFYKDHLGIVYLRPRTGKPGAVQVKAKGADAWTDASQEATGDTNGAEAPAFTIPAGFEGYVKVPLDLSERVVAGENDQSVSMMTEALTWRLALGYKSTADKTAPADYKGLTFVIDDIAFGVSETVVVPQPEAPQGLAGVAPSSTANNDGKITGTSDKMEYRKEGTADYTAVTGAEIAGLSAGNYFVRLKADGDAPAGKDAPVTVPAYIPPAAKDYLRMVNDFETAAKVEEVKGVEYTFLGGADLVPSKAAKATGAQSAMISLQADTQNGFQKLLFSTPTGDLSKADFYQLYIKWTGKVAITFNASTADAEMGTPAWYNRMKKENPTEFDPEDFWKKHIVIGGNVGVNLVGVNCPKVEILKDGKFVETTELPAGYEGLVRFAVPDMSKLPDRHGFGLTLQCADENLAGDLYFDDLMVGMTGTEAAAGYNVEMSAYAADAGLKYDGAATPAPNPGPNTGDATMLYVVVALFMAAASVTVVIFARKARAK